VDRLELLPMLRGAYMAVLGCPVIVRSIEDGRMDIPDLEANFTSGEPDSPCSITWPDKKLSAAVRVKGLGSFYVGRNWEKAELVAGMSSGEIPLYTPGEGASSRRGVVEGKVVLVTGGARGLGAAIARGLAERGAFVIIADINLKGAREQADMLNSPGPRRAEAVGVDVSSSESVRKLAEKVLLYTGGIDALISNAGVVRAGSVLKQSLSDFEFVTRINYSAFFILVRQMASILVGQRSTNPDYSSDIIQINSKSGLVGSNKNAAYAGGKFGGIGLVQSFALELIEYGIKVNAVCPGNLFDGPLWSDPDDGLFVQYFRTGKVPGARSVAEVRRFYEEKVPMGRGCESQDVLRAILYCVEQKYETGQALPVTGGQVMLG